MSADALPADEPARDQISRQLGRTLFVEAGAGTGKTTALVARVVQLVASGAQLRDLAAITFTDAAAAELRDRLRRALEAAERAGTIEVGTVNQLDEAAICTLHAFAQRLLAQYPIEAGLPPAFEVLDEVASAMALRERFTVFLDDLFARPDLESFWMRALACEFRTDRIAELAEIFHDHRDRLPTAPAVVPDPPELDAGALVAEIEALVARGASCTEPTDKLLAKLTGPTGSWRQAGERLAAARGDDLQLLRELHGGPPSAGKLGKKSDWGGNKDAVLGACAHAAETWNALLQRVHTHTTQVLTEEVRRFTHQFAAERVASGQLVFHDLLVLARDVLRANPHVRAQLAARWHKLLIDEFQDTDPLQLEIAVLLAADPESGDLSTAPVNELDLVPGRLFFVGDAKQSIYRFRRADIDAFLRVAADYDTDAVALTTNFRSVPGVIEWVNGVFAHLLTDTEGIGGQAPHQDLVAHRPALTAGPTVRIMGGEHPGNTDDARTAEATEVAATIRAALDEHWPVQDRDGTTRAVKAGDIAILIPTRTVLPHLEAAFTTADLTYRVESASLIWSTQVVRDLLAVLRAIDEPGDEIAVVGALRTSVLACSDQDLLTWHEAGGHWRANAALPGAIGPDHPVASAFAQLRDLGRDHWFTSVSDLAGRVTHELPFFELALAGRRARDHWRQLRFALEQARLFDERPDATLRRFLTWADLQGSDVARVREPALPESDHDAVRVLTIHGAKGLEFPVTIVCGLNVAPRSTEATAVFWSEHDFEVRLGAKFPSPGFEAARQKQAALEAHERARLLYVATTRARDHLVVSLHRGGVRARGTDAASLEGAWHAADPDARLAQPWQPATAAIGTAQTTAPVGHPDAPTSVDAWLAAEQAWDHQRTQLIERMRRAPVMAATAVARLDRPSEPAEPADAAEPAESAEPADDKPEPPPGAPPRRLGRAGTSIGRAVHAVLQTVDLTDPHDLDDLARTQAEAEQVGPAAADIARMANAAVQSDLVRAAVAHRHWRELYVAAPIARRTGEATVVEGFVDLLYDDGDQLVIVDYKTDAVRSDTDTRAAADRYRLQLATYAVALEQTTGRAVGKAALLFVSGSTARTDWVVDLDGAKADVRAVLDRAPIS